MSASVTQAAVVQATERAAHQPRDGGSRPTSPLQTAFGPKALVIKPIPFSVAKAILAQNHYLHSLPGGTRVAFGVFLNNRLLGALTFGSGPSQAHRLVDGATPDDCMTLTRLWLSDELPRNSESHVLGVVLRFLRRHTRLKFVLSYADPSVGNVPHLGYVYQGSNWTYTGLSEAMPLLDLGDGKARHSRSLAHSFGSHSLKHFEAHGVLVRVVPQAAKHRYVYFLDSTWRPRLKVAVLPYPKKEQSNESS